MVANETASSCGPQPNAQPLNPPPVYQCSMIALTAVKLGLRAGRRTRIRHRSREDANLMPIMVAAHARTYPDTAKRARTECHGGVPPAAPAIIWQATEHGNVKI